MHSSIKARLPQVVELCRRYHVSRLDLFGSATTERFDPATSDLDLALTYLPEAKADFPDAYFDLKDGLETLFGRAVDLVMVDAVRNPYFLQEIEETCVSLYAA